MIDTTNHTVNEAFARSVEIKLVETVFIAWQINRIGFMQIDLSRNDGQRMAKKI